MTGFMLSEMVIPTQKSMMRNFIAIIVAVFCGLTKALPSFTFEDNELYDVLILEPIYSIQSTSFKNCILNSPSYTRWEVGFANIFEVW